MVAQMDFELGQLKAARSRTSTAASRVFCARALGSLGEAETKFSGGMLYRHVAAELQISTQKCQSHQVRACVCAHVCAVCVALCSL